MTISPSPAHDGGLGLGTTVTSFLFLGAIVVVVAFLSITRKDVTELAIPHVPSHAQVLIVAHRTAATPRLLEAVRTRVGSAARFASTCSCRTPPSMPR